MRYKMLVAANAAVFGASGIAVAMPAVAQTTSASSSTSSDAMDLQQLQRQISALQAKVDQLEQQEQQEQTKQAAPAPEPVAKSELSAWADNTKISGTMFIDFNNIDQTSNGAKTSASGTGLDVKRFYLSIDHKFDDIWSADLTTDFNYSSTTGETQFFVKKAYLQGAFSDLATLRAGSANMPWIPFAEDWYGYRYVENTLTDRLHQANSADWGLHTLGDNGMFDYQVSVVNGGGYKNPSRSNSVDVAGRLGFTPINGLVVAVGGYSGELGQDTATSPALHTANRFDALVAYNVHGLRLGAEYFNSDNWNNVTTPQTNSADGYSLWGSYDFGPASIFARYDNANLSQKLDPSLKDTYYNAGVAFPVVKGIQVAVVYKHETLRDDSTVDTKTDQIGAWAQVKF